MTTTEISSLVKQYREAQQLAEMAKAEARRTESLQRCRSGLQG